VIDTVLFITRDPPIIYVFKCITILFQIYHPSCYEDYQNVSESFFVFFEAFCFQSVFLGLWLCREQMCSERATRFSCLRLEDLGHGKFRIQN